MATPCYKKIVYGPTADIDPVDANLNVEFPLPSKHKLDTKFVYADDEVTPLYEEHTLSIESIVYNEQITSSNPTNDVEKEIARMKSILSTPGLKLRLYPVGLGEQGVVNGINGLPDLKGGPFPQDVQIMPFASNKAILIRWSVMFRTRNCLGTAPNILQYNVEEDFDVDDDGNLVFTVHINFQSRTPITTFDNLKPLANILIRRVDKSFQGFRKKKRTSFSRDRRIAAVKLVYTELPHDNALYPYTSNIQASDSLESSLFGGKESISTKGFYTWHRTIDISVKLSPRIHKRFAWVIVKKILRERFKHLRLSIKGQALLDVARPGDQPQNQAKQETGWFLPLKMNLSEEIYSREIKVSLDYLVCLDLNSILDGTGMWERVNTSFEGNGNPKDLSDQHQEWSLTRDSLGIDGYFRYTAGGVPITIGLCNNTYSNHEFGANTLAPLEQEEESSSGEEEIASNEAREAAYPDTIPSDNAGAGILSEDFPIVPAYSWLEYENDFEIIEETNNVPVQYLEQPLDAYYTHPSGGAYVNRDAVGMTINGRATNLPQNYPPQIVNLGASQYYVRMTGQAKRANFKIPIPYIVSIGGRTAVRVSQRAKQKQIASGDVPVYMAMWDVTYAVVGGDPHAEDILATLVTTGANAHYI